MGSGLGKRTGGMIGVEENAGRIAVRFHELELARRQSVFKEPLAAAEDQRKDPEAVLIDQIGGDQRLQQVLGHATSRSISDRVSRPARGWSGADNSPSGR